MKLWYGIAGLALFALAGYYLWKNYEGLWDDFDPWGDCPDLPEDFKR